jgi:hypothetical protein
LSAAILRFRGDHIIIIAGGTVEPSDDGGGWTMAMMNHRALVRAHTHWRPRRAIPATTAGPLPARAQRASRVAWLAVFTAALAVAAIALVVLHAGGSSERALPATPSAWLESFSADVATGNGDVCSRLLSPTFRSELSREVHRSCASYYRNAQVLSVRVLRILKSGATAAVEVRYWPRGRYSTFVLDRGAGGWQAVAIVPGGPLPTA